MRLHAAPFVIVATILASGVMAACSVGTEIDDDDEIVAENEDALKKDKKDDKGKGNKCKKHKELLREALVKHNGFDGKHDKAVRRGAKAFDDRKLKGMDGNGRACADCHNASDHFQLSPATVQARWDALQECRKADPNADDPLFRPIDANDFRENGDAANDFTLLKRGLVRVTMPLPPNVKLVGPDGNVTNETFVDVWRAVPTVNNVATSGPDGQLPAWPPPFPPIPRDINGGTGPNLMGGFQHDARFGTLQEQALAALRSHAEIQRDPNPRFLDDVAAFQLAQTTHDYPPHLSAKEKRGKVVFDRLCGHCHGGPSFSTPINQVLPAPTGPFPRYFDILSNCPRRSDPSPEKRWTFKPCPPEVEATVRVYEITMNVPQEDGTITPVTFRRAASDPGRFLLTGYSGDGIPPPGGPGRVLIPELANDWSKLDIMPLRNIKNTAPYFHNNSAETLEEVVDHYEQFFIAVAYLNPPAPILTTTGNINGVPNQDRLFSTAGGIPVPFGPGEKSDLVAYLKRL